MKKFIFIFVFNIFFASSSFADAAKMNVGKEIFIGKGMCGSCHVLKAADSQGQVGPSLDELKPDLKKIIMAVTTGKGIMPAFGSTGMLTKTEIENVAFYIINSSGK
jgi:mono/diheme cytochrome c family protein